MMPRIAFASRALRFMPLAALFAAAGCFATRNDVRVVQSDIASMRTELLRNDAEQRDALAKAMRTIQLASDTVAAMSSRLFSIQGNIAGGLRNIDTQLISVQELLKQSASTIARLRSDAEQRANQAAAAVSPPSGSAMGGVTGVDSSAARTPPQPITGPNELYTTGISNLARGSTSTARNAFQELLDKYPSSDHAAAAQAGIATSWARENNTPAAFAAYGAVISKYPDAPEASNALYKKALILIDQKKEAEAKPLLQQIVTRFKSSLEFNLATDLLKGMR